MDIKAIRVVAGTKISHDYQGSNVNTFSLRELIQAKVEAIGIPARQNRLLIVDVDVAGSSHKHDGREWWAAFVQEYGIPQTYTVMTRSGGYHFYYKIPTSINLDTFSCPAHPIDSQGVAVLGIDFKYNGWVMSPPTQGYTIVPNGRSINDIEELSPAFLAYISNITQNRAVKSMGDPSTNMMNNLYTTFSMEQITELRKKIDWVRLSCDLTRDQWRDGIFSLKAGLHDDEETLQELVTAWTMNKSFNEGDVEQALSIAEKADQFGSVGPGTIFSIIKDLMMEQGTKPQIESANGQSPLTRDEILAEAKIIPKFDRQGNIKVEPSETNAASIIGTIYNKDQLYYDKRNDLYVFNGESYSDQELTNKFLPILQSSSVGLGLSNFRASSLHRGLDILMVNRKIDPHEEYLKSLQWDGVNRIENFFIDYLGVPNTEYYKIASKNFWTALAARGLRPGCKFDSMVVIEGHEGIRKSTLIEIIGGKDYTYAPLSNKAFEDLDELRKMHQAVIVELPELIGLVNRPAEMVKGFLATANDRIRDLFARKAKNNLRGFIIVGTTNSMKYLNANMGLRRFWPVRIPETLETINVEAIEILRDQLYAEAVQWFRSGHKFWDMPYHLLQEVTASRVQSDPLTNCIKGAIMDGESLDVASIYKRVESLGYISKGLNKDMANRIELAMRELGYVENSGLWYMPAPATTINYNSLI